MRRRLHVIVRGDVQGVGFRAFAQREAERRNLTGWVRNLRDGEVEACAEGEEADLDGWQNALSRGPSLARVEELLPVRDDARFPPERRGFEILPTAAQPDPF